jgi:isopentenyl-diphosphate delta-isomerase
MGIDAQVEHRFSFLYKAGFDNGLYEHELDHVFFGRFNGIPQPAPDEADAWQFLHPDALDADLAAHPERYTIWLLECWLRVRAELAVKAA